MGEKKVGFGGGGKCFATCCITFFVRGVTEKNRSKIKCWHVEVKHNTTFLKNMCAEHKQ